jgi:hypothetical protein
MIYGSKHERFIPESLQMAQLTLDLAVETVAPETQTNEVTYTKATSNTSNYYRNKRFLFRKRQLSQSKRYKY